ncbi:glutaredoxin 3 [Vigna unguiculata]|uniref:Glutaredoxin 3 n=1 Tax=Vigna unguiculata TaxID=3917 RepID=A0A4D6N1U9_VIGUN|nr:glutaredoxin 3 [Vigna unguiculata]
MDFYMELENKVCVIKYANNLEVFKVHIKDKRFVLDLMKEKLTTNKENIKEGLKSEKNKYLLKKFDVQVKKVDEDSIKKTVAENPVVVYSKTWCSYSSEVKSLFNKLGVSPLVFELDEMGPQGPQLQKVLERITGQHTVPNVFIDDKTTKEGIKVANTLAAVQFLTDADTLKLYRKGELEPLLSEAKAKTPES